MADRLCYLSKKFATSRMALLPALLPRKVALKSIDKQGFQDLCYLATSATPKNVPFLF